MRLTQTLDRRPALSLVAAFARIEAETALRKIARQFGINKPGRIDIASIKIPDTRIAVEATQLVQKCSPPWLLNHCLRSYFFGMAVGRHINRNPDVECFYLSAMLHDLGLTKTYDSDGSFELNGARAAHQFVMQQGYAEDKAALVHEAIALHTYVGESHKREPEIALVHFGAGVDVIGYRAEDIEMSTFSDIVKRYPRLGFTEQMSLALTDQVGRKPGCSIAGHVALGFLKKLKQAPFNE